MSTIRFYDKKADYYEFSNFYMIPVVYEGKEYPSSEHAYQCQKFLGPDSTRNSRKYASIMRQVNTPNKVLILARQKRVGGYKWRTDLNPTIEAYQNVSIRDDWEDVKDEIMFEIVLAKFTQNKELRKLLLRTKNKEIEEVSPRDTYWGTGKDGNGENKLGKILMEVRDFLRENS